MGRCKDDRVRATGRKGVCSHTAGDEEGLPELTELLKGTIGASGLEWQDRPYKLLIWLDGPVVRFLLTYDGCKEKCWGTIPSLTEGLEGIENALCKGNYEWKDAGEDKNGFTHGRR